MAGFAVRAAVRSASPRGRRCDNCRRRAANESVPIAQMVEAATIQLDVVRRLVGTAREPRVPGGEVK